MTIRTTLSLDDDNAVRLERLRKARNMSLKDVVNDVIRRGLEDTEKPSKARAPFQTKVHDAGRPFRDLSPKEILREMDDAHFEKKLFPK